MHADDKNQTSKEQEQTKKMSKSECLEILDDMIKRIEALPEPAMHLSMNQYDFYSLLILLSATLKAKD